MKLIANAGMAFLITASASTFLANQARLLYLSMSEPFAYGKTVASKDSFDVGEPIGVTFEFTRYRFCEIDINLFVVDRSTNTVIRRQRVVGGATLLGATMIQNVFEFKPDIPPGEYLLRMISYSVCSDGSHTIPAPEVPFKVKASAPVLGQ